MMRTLHNILACVDCVDLLKDTTRKHADNKVEKRTLANMYHSPVSLTAYEYPLQAPGTTRH